MKKKLAALALTLVLLAQSGPLTVAAAAFSDVDEGVYYAAPIAWAVEKGITTGTSETTFSPDALCTRGQIITFLWRSAGSPEPGSMESPYGDVTPDMNADFYRAILWAAGTGILLPGDPDAGGFAPNAPCTRASTMLYLWRYAGAPAAEALAAFTDVAPEADYAQAVSWAVENGITEGTADNTFSPDEVCTRGQIAAFLYRCLNKADEKIELPEPSAPAPAQGQDGNVRPRQVLTGEGAAYSLGLDGSAFTVDGVYEAKATVEIYSAYDAVFTVKAPFPLYQACSYIIRFDDPEHPGTGYLFTFLRWDEAFADMIPWEGGENGFRFTDANGGPPGSQAACSFLEEHRTDGELSWRVSFPENGRINFNLLEGYTLSCEVSTHL